MDGGNDVIGADFFFPPPLAPLPFLSLLAPAPNPWGRTDEARSARRPPFPGPQPRRPWQAGSRTHVCTRADTRTAAGQEGEGARGTAIFAALAPPLARRPPVPMAAAPATGPGAKPSPAGDTRRRSAHGLAGSCRAAHDHAQHAASSRTRRVRAISMAHGRCRLEAARELNLYQPPLCLFLRLRPAQIVPWRAPHWARSAAKELHPGRRAPGWAWVRGAETTAWATLMRAASPRSGLLHRPALPRACARRATAGTQTLQSLF